MPLAGDAVWKAPHPIVRPAHPRAARSGDGGGLGPLRCLPLKAMHRLESHRTDGGGPLIADAPPLTFHQLYDRLFGQLTAGHQGPRPFGALPGACRAAPPFDLLARTGPGPMRNIAFTRLVAPRSAWIWTCKPCRPIRRWRRLYHHGPPMARNRPKD